MRGAPELLIDHELLDGTGTPSPGRIPVGHEVARVDDPDPLLLPRQGADLVREGADLISPRLGLGWQLEGQPTTTTRDGGLGRGAAPRSGATKELPQGHGTAQVQVGVVLPREPDPAEHLDAVLGHVGKRVERHRASGGSRQHQLVAVVSVERQGRVPRHPARLLGGDEHVRTPVLHALELPDRAAELPADDGVRRRGVHAPTGAARRLGGGQGGGQVVDPSAIEAGQLVRHGDHGSVEGEAGDPADGIKRLERGRRPGGAAHDAPALLAVHGDRHHDDVDDASAQHRTGGTRDDDGAVAARLAVQRRAVGDASGGTTGGQLRQQRPVAVTRVDGGARPHRREERTGGAGAPEALEHDRQLREPVPLAPHVLREVQAEPTEPGQLVPERRERLLGSVDRASHDGRSAPRVGEAADGVMQSEVVVADGNGHAALAPSRCLTIVSR